MTLDELLNTFMNKHGDTWVTETLERFFYLHDLTAPWRGTEETEYLLLMRWLKDMVKKGVSAGKGQ